MITLNKKFFSIVFIFTSSLIQTNDEHVNTVAWAYALGKITKEQFLDWQKAYQANQEKKDPGLVRDFINHAAQGWGTGSGQITSKAVIDHLNKFVDPITDACSEYIFGTPFRKQNAIREGSRENRIAARKVFLQSKNEYLHAIVELKKIIQQNPQETNNLISKINDYAHRAEQCEKAIGQLLDLDLNDTEYDIEILSTVTNANIIKRIWRALNCGEKLYVGVDTILKALVPSAFYKNSVTPENSLNENITPTSTNPYETTNTSTPNLPPYAFHNSDDNIEEEILF